MPTRLAEEFAAALIDAHRTRRLVAQTDAAAFAGAATPEDVAAVQSLVAAGPCCYNFSRFFHTWHEMRLHGTYNVNGTLPQLLCICSRRG